MDYPPLKGAALAWVTLSLGLAVFMEVLDTTIANVAVPVIAGNLGAATTQGTWVITSFSVANAVSVPLTGFLAKRIGEVKLFTAAAAGFVIASWLCGIAPNLQSLVVFRILQGFIAGPLIPLSQSLLMASYPPAKRMLALALWAMTVVVAPVLGPILGGWISGNWHWGWIFFINIPIGIISAWITWKHLKHRETATVRTPTDYVGLTLMMVGIGALQMMLDRGKELDWFASGEIITLGVVALVCLSYFIVWELGEKYPIVDLSLFKDRNFTVGVIATSLGFMVYMGTLTLLPLVLQTNLGYTSAWAGLAAAPVGILPVFLSPLIGRFGNKIDMRLLVTASFLTFAFTFYWRTDFYADMDIGNVIWPQFWQGVGVAMFFLPLTTITLSHMKGGQIAAAGSLSNADGRCRRIRRQHPVGTARSVAPHAFCRTHHALFRNIARNGGAFVPTRHFRRSNSRHHQQYHYATGLHHRIERNIPRRQHFVYRPDSHCLAGETAVPQRRRWTLRDLKT